MSSFYNQATLNFNGETKFSNITTGELVDSLVMNKTAVDNTYSSEEKVSFIINIVNNGDTALTNLNMVDDLGTFTPAGSSTSVTPLTYTDGSLKVYVNGTLSTGTVTAAAGPPLVISNISVPANGNVILVYEATVNDYAPLSTGSSIENTATLTGTALSEEISASETINADNSAYLYISKSESPSVISEDEEITYTFTIQNFGNTATTTTDTVTLTDKFTPILNISSVTIGGNPAPAGSYTYDQTTGVFETVNGAITVPAAEYYTDPSTNIVSTNPGTVLVSVTGTIA